MVSDEMERNIQECVEHAAEKRDLSEEQQGLMAQLFRFDVFVYGQFFYDREAGRRVDPARVNVRKGGTSAEDPA